MNEILVKKNWKFTRNPLFPGQEHQIEKCTHVHKKKTRVYGETLNKPI